MKGFWGRGVEVIGEWVKKRESGGVGGDPVGSTDPEVSRHLHPCTNLGMQNALAHNSGRSAPDWCLFWAFSARMLSILGVQRQNHALFWR